MLNSLLRQDQFSVQCKDTAKFILILIDQFNIMIKLFLAKNHKNIKPKSPRKHFHEIAKNVLSVN